MNLNTSSAAGAGAGAIDLKIASSGAKAWSILGQLPSPGQQWILPKSTKRKFRISKSPNLSIMEKRYANVFGLSFTFQRFFVFTNLRNAGSSICITCFKFV